MRRVDRLTQLFKDEIGQIIQQEIKDTRLGFITITGVKLTPDLRQAWVYFSVLGDKINKEKASQGLKSASGYIKRLIGQRIKMRYTPEIEFELDETWDKMKHIENILDKIRKEEK
jgi:ribosome-binding factor A